MTDQGLQQKRLVAAAIDIGVAVALAVMLRIVGFAIVASGLAGRSSDLVGGIAAFGGAFVVFAYILGRDVLAGGRSFGKQIMGIRIVGATGAPCTLLDSVKRNALFAVGSAVNVVASALMMVPFLSCLVGCVRIIPDLAAAVLGLVVLIIEIAKIVTEPHGIRIGDEIAGTRVVL